MEFTCNRHIKYNLVAMFTVIQYSHPNLLDKIFFWQKSGGGEGGSGMCPSLQPSLLLQL